MAYTITITSSVQTINRAGDTAQLILTFDVTGTGGSVAATMVDWGIRVGDWGTVEWSYDFEDALLVPGTYRVKLFDEQSYLKDLFFGVTGIYPDVAKTPKVEFKLNGVVEYVGYVVEDSINYVTSEKSVTFTVDPDTIILNKSELFALDGTTPVNPLGYTPSEHYPVTTIIEDLFQLVNPTLSYTGGTVKITQDWLFWGTRYLPTNDGHLYTDLLFSEIRQNVDPLFFDSTYGMVTVGDVLKKLAMDWCCFTGMVHHEKAFFKKLFYFDESNTQVLGTILNREFSYKYTLIDYVEVTVEADQPYNYPVVYTRGTNSHLQDRYIKRSAFPGFYIVVGPPDPPPYSGATNVLATTTRGSYPGTYYVFQAADPRLLAGAVSAYGDLSAEFWWLSRSNPAQCRIDKFNVVGITYDFLKDFVDDGHRYQPIAMRKYISKNETEIEAIYLGEDS